MQTACLRTFWKPHLRSTPSVFTGRIRLPFAHCPRRICNLFFLGVVRWRSRHMLSLARERAGACAEAFARLSMGLGTNQKKEPPKEPRKVLRTIRGAAIAGCRHPSLSKYRFQLQLRVVFCCCLCSSGSQQMHLRNRFCNSAKVPEQVAEGCCRAWLQRFMRQFACVLASST